MNEYTHSFTLKIFVTELLKFIFGQRKKNYNNFLTQISVNFDLFCNKPQLNECGFKPY